MLKVAKDSSGTEHSLITPGARQLTTPTWDHPDVTDNAERIEITQLMAGASALVFGGSDYWLRVLSRQ